jgi:hypothetical protein
MEHRTDLEPGLFHSPEASFDIPLKTPLIS